MESTVIRGNDRGLAAPGVECWALGAERKVTKATRNLPEADQRHYFQLHLAPTSNGERVYVFADEAHAGTVAAALREAGEAVKVSVDLSVQRDAVRANAVKVVK